MTQPPLENPAFHDIAPPGGFVSSLAFHPADPDLVYAGLDDSGGLYASRDRGITWEMLKLPKQNLSAWMVLVDPRNHDTLYVADCYGHGVFRSDDAGENWTECNDGLDEMVPQRLVRGLSIDPENPDILHAGTKGAGIYRSTDRASHWTKANTGLPDDIEVYRFARPANRSFPLFAGVQGGAIYRSMDGLEWTQCADVLPELDEGEFWDLAVAPSNPDWVLAGMCMASKSEVRMLLSKDGGDSWEAFGEALFKGQSGFPVGVAFAFDPKGENVVYVAGFVVNGHTRRFRSDDGGATFKDITGDFARESVFRLAVSPHDSNVVIAGLIGEGINFSHDRGDTWKRHEGRPSYPNAPGGFAIAPSDPNRLYMAACMQTIVRSDDHGKSWRRFEIPEWTLRLFVHPEDPDFVIAAPLHVFSTGLLRSRNGGESWEKIGPNCGVTHALFDPDDPTTIYVSTFCARGGEFGLYRSKDSGDSFERITPDAWTGGVGVMTVCKLPGGEGPLALATTIGLYVSDKDQANFTLKGLEGKVLFGLDVAPSGLWVVGGQNEAYISRDDGETWTTHALPGCSVFPVLIDTDANDRILLGPSAADVNAVAEASPGLFVSHDRGSSFREISRELYPSDQVYWLAKAGKPDTYLFSLYSSAGGLYEFSLAPAPNASAD